MPVIMMILLSDMAGIKMRSEGVFLLFLSGKRSDIEKSHS
jgi:hypothetical protein